MSIVLNPLAAPPLLTPNFVRWDATHNDLAVKSSKNAGHGGSPTLAPAAPTPASIKNMYLMILLIVCDALAEIGGKKLLLVHRYG